MKAFAVTSAGIEKIAVVEISELSSAADISSSGDGVITFSVSDVRDFCTLSYRSQSLSRLCCLICEFDAASSLSVAAKNLKQKLKGFKMSDWIADGDSFVVDCGRFGSHDFNSLDFSTEANKIISEISGNKSVSFKSPLLRFFCHIAGNRGYFGVDIAGFDLGKREYRIFGHASDLKAAIAYALVRLSGFTPKSSLLDPFCRSGAIAIEAALFASAFPVNYYRKDAFSFRSLKPFSKLNLDKLFVDCDRKIRKEKLRIFNYGPSVSHTASSEKNAKIAGVNKLISFSRVDTEWLELKFDREKIDFIVSFPPLLSRNSDASKIRKLYSEFFYQANLILSKKGKIVLAAFDAEAFEAAAAARSFVLESKLEFLAGSEKRLAVVFRRL